MLRDHGKLVVAGGGPNGDYKSEGTQNAKALQERFQKMPQVFDKVQTVVMKKDNDYSLGPPESADMVVTFRNLHNYVEGHGRKNARRHLQRAEARRRARHHRPPGEPRRPQDPKVNGDTGYMPEDFAVKVVEAAGFKPTSRR